MRPPALRGAFETARPPPATAFWGRDKSLLRHMGWLDVVIFFGWVLSTTMPFGWAQPLRYLAAAYFCGATVLLARQTMPTALRAWPTFIIPIMCIVSATWAPYANEAIRKGLLLALTSMVAIYVASRLSGRQILTVFFAAETIAALLTVVQPNVMGGAWTGIFGQKNFLAVHMFILFTCAIALVLDKEANRWIRLAALVMLPISMYAIFMAKSATTTLQLIGAGAALVGHAFLWKPASRVKHMRTFILLAMSVLVLAAALVVFGLLQFDAGGSLLEALGKDSTLTGRTYLWETAERVMEENPWTGVGAEGFWRPEYGVANSITEYFHFERYVRFSFHNSYLENGVSFGYAGYWATVFLAGWALVSIFMIWLHNQTITNAAFLMLGAMIIIRSTAEIDLAQEFAGTAVLLFIGALRRDKPAPAPHAPTLKAPGPRRGRPSPPTSLTPQPTPPQGQS